MTRQQQRLEQRDEERGRRWRARSVRIQYPDGTERVLYKPQAKQQRLHESTAPNVLYGGAAGGGKSHAARWHAIIGCLTVPGFRALLLRREYKELETTHILAIQAEIPPELGRWKDSKQRLEVPHGEGPTSILQLGHCQHEKDVGKYLSTEWDLIVIDEASLFTPYMLTMLASRLRTTKPGVKPQYVLCTNPGGEGHLWLLQRFITRDPPEDEAPGYDPDEWEYIPALVEDNRFIGQDYIDRLEKLPEQLREAYRHGNWLVFAGQFFRSWNPAVHTVDAYPPEPWMEVEAGMDYGYDPNPGVLLVAAFDNFGRPRLFRELQFRLMTSDQIAEAIHANCTTERELTMTIHCDPSMQIRNPETGVSIMEAIQDRLDELGSKITLQPANNDRINGWARVHQYLAVRPQPDGTREPTLKVMKPDDDTGLGCRYLIQTIGAQMHDEHRPGDMKKSATDHACDGLRYLCMARPPLSQLPEAMQPAKTHGERVHERNQKLLRKMMLQQQDQGEDEEIPLDGGDTDAIRALWD